MSTKAVETEEMSSSGPANAPGAHVIRSLRRWMDEGVLVNGQPLPSERALSEELGVARKTVRRALAILEEDGLLRSTSGGPRVVSMDGASRGSFMSHAIVVLTRVANKPWIEHRQSGWEEYVTHGAMHAIRAAGLHSISLQPARLPGQSVQDLIAERPHGVVITDFASREESVSWAHALRAAKIPVTIYGGSPLLADFDRVVSDHEAGSYQLTRWLIERGRKRIMPLWWRLSMKGYWYAARRAGYERAMTEAKLKPLPSLEIPDLQRTDEDDSTWFDLEAKHTAQYLREYLMGSRAVEALLIDSDGRVGPAASACRLLGLEPNKDVALVGYDNYWRESPQQNQEPISPLATADKQNLKMGHELVELLLQRIAGKLPPEPQCRVVEPRVIDVEKENAA